MERDAKLLTAGDIMRQEVLTFRPEDSMADAIEELVHTNFSGAPVVDDDEQLVGVLTERDCLQFLASAAFHQLPTDEVGDHMSHDVVVVGPDVDMFRLVFLFHEKPFRRLPVVDEDDRLVGIVARRDLLVALDEVRKAREAGRPHETTIEAIARRRDAER